MNFPILNRKSEKPADGFYHLVPKGEFPGTKETNGQPQRITQVLDDAALTAMVNRFNTEQQQPNATGLRVDFDHFSYDHDKSSEAAGWIERLENRADGLWGKIDWTDTGDQAVTNKRFRLVSPVWLPKDTQPLGGDRLRPLRLDSVALTNNPNLRGMVPLSNRAGNPPADNPQQHTAKPMKTVATKLGLSAEASEDAILTAVAAIMNRAEKAEAELTPIKNRVTELEAANTTLADEQIDGLLDHHGVTDAKKRGLLKTTLKPMKNRADRVDYLTSVVTQPATTPKQGGLPILNRAEAKNPGEAAAPAGEPDAPAMAVKQRAAVDEYRIANRCTYATAQTQVRRLKPELFGLTA